MTTSRRWLLVGLLGLSLLGLSACNKERKFNGVDITGATYAQDFELTDHNGQSRHLTDFKGKVVVLFFGYTQCPDVCPTSLSDLVRVKQLLGAKGDKLQAVFVTVDPERDMPEMLKAYMENFDPSFLAFVPSKAQLETVAKDFKIYYKRVEGKTPTSYTMDHSAGSYVYDTQGRVRVYSRYATPVEQLAQDVQSLIDEAR